jgi:hypothetical protein
MIMLVGIPVAFTFWYRAIYHGVKHDRSASFFVFYLNYGFHLAVVCLLGIGLPGWGGAGLIYVFDTFGAGKTGAGIVCLLNFICFALQLLYGLWHLRLATLYYRSKGMSAEEAKQQALQSVASSGIGQTLAREAIKSSMV